ncbi:hypothetical protein IFM89_006121 [Coptis chinensis]|uniref:GBF-interacting protein 1 N-terminal domain-containing protein n=1 Tax=Coptis chinensis TaxID=261450 RepID=A0A835GXC3_9MAGN|nr:hypothetical protein IFM89_006121 [Coptis chinensis]
MSSGRSNKNHNGGGGNVMANIPQASRNMVKSLKEIVNCPEDEIYYMLKECNMDANDAVQRLLSQDTFQEVKSRKDKKKEIKEPSESRPRGVGTTSNRGGRGGGTRYDGRSGSSQFSSSDSGVLRGKPAYKKENGTADLSNSFTSASGMPRSNSNRRPISYSDSVTAEIKPQITDTTDVISPSLQPSQGPAWVGAPGQVSMADIVKKGRPKPSSAPYISTDTYRSSHSSVTPTASYHNVSNPTATLPLESPHGLETSHESGTKVSESVHEAGIDASGPSVLEPTATSQEYTDPSISTNLHADRTKLHQDSWSDEVRGTERDVTAEHLNTSYIGSASASGRQIQADYSEGASHFDKDSFNNMNSYQPENYAFEHHEGGGGSTQLSVPNYSVSSIEDASVAVSSAAADLQQLNLQEEQRVPSSEVNPAANHLQIPSAECSHLTFGSFGSGIDTSYPGPFASKSLKSNLEENTAAVNTASSTYSETRNPQYFGDEHLQSTSDGNVAPRMNAVAGSYDTPSHPDAMKQDAGDATHEHQYSFPTSVPSYALDNSAQLNAAFSYEQQNSQMHNLAPLSSVMQAYSNSLQGNLLASTVQPARDSSDLTYSAFIASQSMPTKYSTAVSSIGGTSLSMPESVKPGMFSMPHPSAQTLPGANIATGPALPQHLAVHPYSQPTLPLGPFANMIGYPFLPQSYAYMPSAYQQAYGGSSTYHQSPAAVHNNGMKYTLPQYKSNAPVSSLPPSASVASGYGGFGSSANIPGSFPLNPSTTPASTTVGYDDLMSSQYKENNHFLPLQQNDNSTVWVQGPGSRTMAALPASTYYSFQGQGQQHSGYRQQGQQPSQHYGNLGYQNFYHSQAGVSQEHQQPPPNEGTLTASQGQPNKQSHQIWQQSY